jgi:hypothetical protein
MLPVQTEQAVSWPNPVAQTSGTKDLQNGDFVVEYVVRPHKPNRFTSDERQIERRASCPAHCMARRLCVSRGFGGELSEGAGGEIGEPLRDVLKVVRPQSSVHPVQIPRAHDRLACVAAPCGASFDEEGPARRAAK